MSKHSFYSVQFWLLCLGLTICSALAADPEILIQGAPLIGGCNGMYFDEDNHLHVAQVYGRECYLDLRHTVKTNNILPHSY